MAHSKSVGYNIQAPDCVQFLRLYKGVGGP